MDGTSTSLETDRGSLKNDEVVTSDPTNALTEVLQHHSHQPDLQRVKDRHKTSMKNKYERLFKNLQLQETQTFLKRFDTEPQIKDDETEEEKEEHDVLYIERTARTQHSQDDAIHTNDIFKPSPNQGTSEKHQIKTVLTKGIAGIGKTVSVMKFVLDWAEGKANQDVDFIFVFPFRELNLMGEHQYSLHRLLLDFHPELRDLSPKFYEECKVAFVLDGLDESRTTLVFSDSEEVSDVTETSSVSVLMSKLLKGDLLPSALIWITSRPAGANQIPSRYVDRLTEIQGFDDSQKEEYFRKRIGDDHQASRIISHIRRSRCLYTMCQIPAFCRISFAVFQNTPKQDTEIPKTLTETYIQFLLIQINKRNQTLEERDPEKILQSNRGMIVKLAKLAFKQLMKGNVMFYEEDLIESGIDVTDTSMFSTDLFEEESAIHQEKIYSFIHLSFQEFLAAFYAFNCYLRNDMEPLQSLLDEQQKKYRFKKIPLYTFLKSAVDRSLRRNNNQPLDLFVRFLMGFQLESNQKLLKDLLAITASSSKIITGFMHYIKNMVKGCFIFPAVKSISLLHCLLEMNDQSLHGEIDDLMILISKSDNELYASTSFCSAIAYVTQTSEVVTDQIDPKKFNTPNSGRWRLIPAVVNCRKAELARCLLSYQHCESLASALRSPHTSLTELDLSFNGLRDPGVKLLSTGLRSSHCQLNTLRLCGCFVSDKSCESLSSALQSPHTLLKDLDLSFNDLQDSGVKHLCDGLKSSHCQLNALRMAFCNLTGQCCESLASALQSSSSRLKDLDLNNNDLRDSGVKLLSEGIKSQKCQLNILRLSGCMVTEEGCVHLSSALRSNPSHLRELDLSYNHPGESGVKLFLDLKNRPNCALEKLNVDQGGEIRITEGLHKYACNLTLDPNTAHNYLILSEENRKVTYVGESQSYPDRPERFDKRPHVLCGESLSGRCYWEAEWSGCADMAVVYKVMGRKGKCEDTVYGFNKNSWCLACREDTFILWHGYKATDTHIPTSSHTRIGVYVDVSGGTLSFYSVSDTHKLTHLHTFNTTFTESLYAGFGFMTHPFNSTVTVTHRLHKGATPKESFPTGHS